MTTSMNGMRRLFQLVWALVLLCAAPVGLGAAHTEVELSLSHREARAGESITAVIRLRMPTGWHTYWRNPGESGEATKVVWDLPPGWEAGALEFPAPEKHVAGGFTTYVHHGEISLLNALKIPASAPAGEVILKGKVVWQECEEVCIKGKKEVQATIKIGTDSTSGPGALLAEAAVKSIPKPGVVSGLKLRLEPGASADERVALLEWDAGAPSKGFDFIPFEEQGGELEGASNLTPVAGKTGAFVLRKKLTLADGKAPSRIAGLILAEGMPAVAVDLPVAAAATAAVPAAAASEPSGGGAESRSLGLMLVFSFVGGLILNFMPCVLPVIALKVLSFVNQSKEEPGRVRLLGITYGVGVLASFLALGLMAIGAQKAGGLASWGMALQNQVFRALLTMVVALVALNLFGVFEVTLHGGVMGAASQLTAKEGTGGAFFNGVLATVLATPCTAPFLGVALAFAFTQPAPVTILLFLTAGAGLAAPFVLLCWNPRWMRWMPRPGGWMVRFKVAMGFPMMATAVWLFWFTAPRYGKSGVLWFGLFLVLLSMAAWVFGEFVQKGQKARGLSAGIAFGMLAAGYFGLLEGQLQWRVPPAKQTAGSLKEGNEGIDWQPWSPEAVASARDTGKVILVDFTAENCLNCQVNKKTSLEIPQTRQKLKELGVICLLGDFTDEDPRIAAELQRYKRAGVPLVLVYPKDKTKPAIVLPTILTPRLVLDAIDAAAKS